jgi:hypothetical protein
LGNVRRLAGKYGGLAKAAKYPADELTNAARAAFLGGFLVKVDEQFPGLSEPERRRRAEALKKAHFARLALLSAQKRAKKALRKKSSSALVESEEAR